MTSGLIFGSAGRDVFDVTDGTAKIVRAGAGDDVVVSGSGQDRLFGDEGNDLLIGGGGADELHGGPGDDIQRGGDGDDYLYIDEGNDLVDGGLGRDTFEWDLSNSAAGGASRIKDLSFQEGDRLLIRLGEAQPLLIADSVESLVTIVDSSPELSIERTNGGTRITYGAAVASSANKPTQGASDAGRQSYRAAPQSMTLSGLNQLGPTPPHSPEVWVYGPADFRFALRVAGVGDLNADGYDDFAATGVDNNSFASVSRIVNVYVIFGGPRGPRGIDPSDGSLRDFPILITDELDGRNGFSIGPFSASAAFGEDVSISAAGDFNGDGISDLVVGEPAVAPDGSILTSDAGRVVLVFGSYRGFPAALNPDAFSVGEGLVIDGSRVNGRFGSEVGRAGDFNADGVDDIIVSAIDHDNFSQGSVGRVNVVFGTATSASSRISIDSIGQQGQQIFRRPIGLAAVSSFGRSVSGGWDVGGDGNDDILIGDPLSTGLFGVPTGGQSYGIFGSATGYGNRNLLDVSGTNGFRFLGEAMNARLSIGSHIVEDVNGDSLADIAVVSDSDFDGSRSGGEISVLFGSRALQRAFLNPSAVDSQSGFRIVGLAPFSPSVNYRRRATNFVSSVKDATGDSIAELLVGNTEANMATGAVYLISYPQNQSVETIDVGQVDGQIVYRFDNNLSPSPTPEFGFGSSFAGAGDVNGDGFGEILIGSPSEPGRFIGTSARGRAFLYFGDPVLLEFLDSQDVSGIDGIIDPTGAPDLTPECYDRLDNDSDGLIDLADPSCPFPLWTSESSSPPPPTQCSDGLDNDADGLVDLNDPGCVDASDDDESDNQPPPPIGPAENVHIRGIAAGDGLGLMVTDVGDVNNDGFDDALLAAPYADPRNGTEADLDNSQLYLLFGSASGIDRNIDLSSLNGQNGYVINGHYIRLSGESAAAAGDMNGDQYGDIVIGSANAHPNSLAESGQAYILFGGDAARFAAIDSLDGNSNGVIELSLLGDSLSQPVHPFAPPSVGDASLGFVVTGAESFDHLGSTVAGAGDINADGFDDILIGARTANAGGTNRGAGYVVFGAASGIPTTVRVELLDGINGFSIIGASDGDTLGDVDGIGDVNNDGIDDIVLGSARATPGGAPLAGAAYVVYGSNGLRNPTVDLASLDGSNGFTVTSSTTNALTGFSLAGLGDMNADSIDDLAIAYRPDPSGNATLSEVVTLYGNPTGFSAVVTLESVTRQQGYAIRTFQPSQIDGAGDVNGDGANDLLVGVNGAAPNGTSAAGTTYLIHGPLLSSGPQIDPTQLDGVTGFVINGHTTDQFSGTSVSGAGDVDNDGFNDLLVGAPGQFGSTGSPLNAGEVYLMRGGVNLDQLDGADGTADGQIDLSRIN